MFRFIFTAIIFLLNPQNIFCQDDEVYTEQDSVTWREQYGVFGQFNIDWHLSGFKNLPGVPSCCKKFEGGYGDGFAFGVSYDYPIKKDLLVGVRAGYNKYGGELKEIEGTSIIIDGLLKSGQFQHVLKTELSEVGFTPLVGWNFTRNFFLQGGFSIGYVSSSNYDYHEEIYEPERIGTFADSNGVSTGSRVRAESKGDLQNAEKIKASLVFGLSYLLPLNKENTLYLAPELFYTFGLTPVVKDINWSVNELKIGVSLRYSPPQEIFIPEEYHQFWTIDTTRRYVGVPSPDTIVPGKPDIIYDTIFTPDKRIISANYFRMDTLFSHIKFVLNASIEAFGVDSLGEEEASPTFIIEEFLSTKMHPLLNYVFFEDNSAEIPSRYKLLKKSEAKAFANKDLKKMSTMDIYLNMLNIVGSRMKKYPEAILKIEGCNSDRDNEAKNVGLSKDRASKVRDYLRDVWGIPETRLALSWRNLPEKPSTPEDEESKKAENRRVELSSDEYEILKYVMVYDTTRTVNPPIVRFKPKVETEAGLKLWNIQVVQKNKIIKDFAKKGFMQQNVDMSMNLHEWNMEKDQNILAEIVDTLFYKLKVIDTKYQGFTTDLQPLPVVLKTIRSKREERTADKIIDRYSLILFDFDQAGIVDNNRKIADFIKSRLTPNSTVKIEGFTDMTGDEFYNQRLSQDRARETAAAIGSADASITGYGESQLLYGNDLPEGRFYCRTVNITVETLYQAGKTTNFSIE